MENKWKFQEQKNLEELVFNSSLEKFYNFRVDGIVRENIQNSLDAKTKNSKGPVKVKIKLDKISTKNLPGIEELLVRIPHLKGQSEYTKETIESMKNITKNSEVQYISFEDENTKGLKYSSDPKIDTWQAYAYRKGVHNIDSDSEHEMNRGGSHGIGKIASNAASGIHVVYFANCDDEGNKHLGGTVQLIEHEYNGKTYRATGYYTDDLTGQKPFINEEKDIFNKSTRGLKLIIPYYREEFGTEKDIIKSICNSFFVAICEDKLNVEVNSKIITKETLENYIKNEEYYIQDASSKEMDFAPLYYDTYKNIEKQELIIKDKKREYAFDLYFQYNDILNKGRVGIIRSIGMKIEDFKVQNAATKPFNAVLIPSNSEVDKFLKSLENESHTELSHKHFKQKEHSANARTFIINLTKGIKNILDEYIKKNNQTDGKIETNDLIYEVENAFKKIFNQNTSVYNTGEADLIKRTPEKLDIEAGPKKPRSATKPVKKKKEEELEEDSDSGPKELYKVSPHCVNRALLRDKEVIEIDLSESFDIKNGQRADLSIKIIDGTGRECDEEFILRDNYTKVKDRISHNSKKIENNKIKNLRVKENKIKLILTFNENFNKSLKFTYYLEV